MDNELLQRIIEEVVSRLKKRAENTLTLSVVQLREIDSRTVCCQYLSLHLQQVDLPLPEQVAEGCPANVSVGKIYGALACGVRVKISLQHRLLPIIPVEKLARLPSEFDGERGRIVFLHPEKLLSYTDVAQLGDGVLVLCHQCVVTALTQEAVSLRNIQLIKQERTMHLARVTGVVASTQKSLSLVGKKPLLVRRVSADGELPASPVSGDEVAVDFVGTGTGELVLLNSGFGARHVFSGPNEAIDLAIVGIVDTLSRQEELWRFIPALVMSEQQPSLPDSA